MTQFLQQSFPEMTVQIKTVARMQIYSKIYPKNFPIANRDNLFPLFLVSLWRLLKNVSVNCLNGMT